MEAELDPNCRFSARRISNGIWICKAALAAEIGGTAEELSRFRLGSQVRIALRTVMNVSGRVWRPETRLDLVQPATQLRPGWFGQRDDCSPSATWPA